jgi:hypothetical protein
LTLPELLSTGNGNCYTWGYFLKETLAVQGLSTINGTANIGYRKIYCSTSGWLLAVNKWTTVGLGKTGPWSVPVTNPLDANPPFDRNNPYFNAGVDGKTKLPVALKTGEAADAEGGAGQGHSPNPPAVFGNHCIVKVGDVIYDPSYGVGPAASPAAYEKVAFKGYIELEPKTLVYQLHDLSSVAGTMCTGY